MEKTVVKKKKKKKKNKKNNGFEILEEKFIEDPYIPRLDKEGNIVLKKKIKVVLGYKTDVFTREVYPFF